MDLDDSDLGLSHNPGFADADTDSQNGDKDPCSLQSVTDRLRTENSFLKAQFDQAVIVAQEIDDLHQKNLDLVAMIHSLQSEKSDLSSRLELALRDNSELSSRLASEVEATSQHLTRQSAETAKEIARIRQQADLQVTEALQRAKLAEEASHSQELANRILSGKHERLIESGSKHFFRQLSNIDEVIEALSRPIIPDVPIRTEDARISSLTEQLQTTAARLKKEKTVVSSSKKQIESLKAEILKLRRDVADGQNRIAQKQKDFEEKFADQKQEADSKDAERLRAIEDLNIKNEGLKGEIELLKRQQKEIKPPKKRVLPELVLQVPEVKKADPTRELRAEIENLKEYLADRDRKLRNLESHKEEISESFLSSEEKNRRLAAELENAKGDLERLTLVHSETVNEIGTLRKSLHAATSPDKSPELKAIRRLKSHARTLQETVSSQSTTIHHLALEKEQQVQQLRKAQSKLESARDEASDCQNQIASLKAELARVRAQAHEKTVLSPDDVMPLSAWRTTEFDRDLCQEIDKIAVNSSLQPVSKLAHVYRLISGHFASQIQQREAAVASALAQIDRVREIVNKFTIDVSVSLSVSVVDFENFIDGGSAKIVKAVATVVQSLEEGRRLNYQFKALGDRIAELFGEGPDLFAKVAEVRESLDRYIELDRVKSKKNRELQAKLQRLKSTTSQKIADLTRENSDFGLTVSALEQRAADSAEVVKRLKADLIQARQDAKDVENAAADSALALKLEQEKTLNQSRAENQQVQAQLTRHIQQLRDKLAKAGEELESHEQSIAKLQQQLHAAQNQFADTKQQLAEAQRAKESEISDLEARARSDRDSLVVHHEKTMADLKSQCDAHRHDLETVSVALSESEERNRKAHAALVSLKRERRNLQSEIRTLQEKNERDAQVAQATIKSVTLAGESNLAQKIQDLKGRFENEKRRLFSAAADEFRVFFNAAEAIDESSYHALLARVKNDLQRLTDAESAVRRLVGATPRQSTDDAVARALIR
jgi:chromosome segregation ATPase